MGQTRIAELTSQWLAILPSSAMVQAGPLREHSDIEVLESVDERAEDNPIWLRGELLDDALRRQLRSILGCQLFYRLADGQLLPDGATIPRGYAPKGEWKPLRQWLTLSLPVARFAASHVAPVPVSLVRSTRLHSPQLVRLSLVRWLNYCETAPEIRLSRLVYAASGDVVVVIGDPLPPLRGDFFYVCRGVAAPVGFTWHPELDAAVLSNAFGLEGEDVALLLPEGGVTIIRGDQLVGATRSSVRLTAGVECDGS